MHSSTIYFLSFAVFLRSSIAKPFPSPQYPIPIDFCTDVDNFPWEYTVTENPIIAGDEQQLSDCTGPGCSVASGSEYSVAVTVTVGGTVDISTIVGVGVEANVATTTTTGKTAEVGIECTGRWTCSAVITPQIMVVKGEKFHNKDQGCGEDRQPYEVRLPVLDGDNLPLVHIEPCVCKNYLYWAEAGDLSPCPKECTPNKGH